MAGRRAPHVVTYVHVTLVLPKASHLVTLPTMVVTTLEPNFPCATTCEYGRSS